MRCLQYLYTCGNLILCNKLIFVSFVELTTREAISQISKAIYSINFGGDGSLVAAGDNGLFTLSTELTLTSHQPAPPLVAYACFDESGILVSGTWDDCIRG